MSRIPRAAVGTVDAPDERPHLLADLAEGLRFAWARPELMGTYIVDIVAMAFAFPVALFPAMAAADGRTESVGWLLSAMSIGALIVGLFSGWTGQVTRHGRAVIIAAAVWALGIVALGFAPSLMLGARLPGRRGRRRHGQRCLPRHDLEPDHPEHACAVDSPASR
ncbi:MAG: hypothetical protein QM706_07070 [Nitrospira sp.]